MMNSKSLKSLRIAELNDLIRKHLQISVFGIGKVPPGLYAITRGISELTPEQQIKIFAEVRNFDAFNEENDPYCEHDVGSFDFPGVGKIFWKIDYYADYNCQYGSEDPSDPDKSFRVLTVMLANEY